MKTSRFSDSQITAILKQAEFSNPVPELCREHGISSVTFYKWRSKKVGTEIHWEEETAVINSDVRGRNCALIDQTPVTLLIGNLR